MTTNMGSSSTTNTSAGQERTDWASLNPSVYVKILVIALLLYWFFREDIGKIIYRWATDASWSHGFLIPMFSLYFLNQRKNEILQLKMGPNYLGLAVLVCCFVFYALDVAYFKIAYFQPLTLVAAIGAIVLFFGGWGLVRYAWLPVTYLVFAIKLPDTGAGNTSKWRNRAR